MQNKILEILINADDYVSGQDISDMLGVSRQAIWKSINALKEKEYVIDSITNKGYKLTAFPTYLNENKLKAALKTSIIGKNLIIKESVGSTNDYLKRLGNEGCANGTVVTSRLQTNGKGRLGRAWIADKDECIAFSFLLRPQIAPYEVSAITPLAGLAVCKALRNFTGLDCKIKWPNDIIVGRKKLVGILTEMSAEFDTVHYIVTGIGINCDTDAFPEELAQKATSIVLETGTKPDKNNLLAAVLGQIEYEFSKNNLKFSADALSEYSDLCATIGRNVTFTRNGESIGGMAVGIDKNGELKVMLKDGTVSLVSSGEVVVQGIY